MAMGLKEAVVEAKKEDKMVIKEVEASTIPAGFNRGCPRTPFKF